MYSPFLANNTQRSLFCRLYDLPRVVFLFKWSHLLNFSAVQQFYLTSLLNQYERVLSRFWQRFQMFNYIDGRVQQIKYIIISIYFFLNQSLSSGIDILSLYFISIFFFQSSKIGSKSLNTCRRTLWISRGHMICLVTYSLHVFYLSILTNVKRHS